MKNIAILLFCAFLGLTIATVDHWNLVPGQQVDDKEAFDFKLVLQQQNVDYLEKLFWQISDPDSPLFAKYLTNDQIADLIAPPTTDIEAVEDYLTQKSGQVCDVTTTRSVHRDYLYVQTCAGQAKHIFPNLSLAVYQRENSDQMIVRSSILVDVLANQYLLGVPHTVMPLISAIHEVTDTPVPIKHANGGVNPLDPWQISDKELTINDMVKQFNISYDGIDSALLETDNGQVRQGVIEFFHTDFSAKELEDYQKKYDLPINPIRKIIGTETNSEEEGTEVSLDVQTITGISGNVHTWDFVFKDKLCWLDVVETVMTTSGAPKVLSCSWGTWETDFNESKVAHVNTALMKLGLAGFTFFIAAGDSGPSLQNNCKYYDPQFPATSPFVVSVGGTKITKDTGVEGAWTNSSGGFSFLNPRPKFQDEKVGHYVKNAKFPANAGGKVFNTTGRGFPDVSAFGAYQEVLADGYYDPVGGTSSATPQFAAVVALINIHRFKQGLAPIGPLTQTLYKLEKGVGFDVVEGQSYATNNQGKCMGDWLPGYETLEGWDAVTGLGSPRFDVLLDQLLHIQGEKSQ